MSTAHRFGPFEARPTERQLLVQGRPVPIGARAFDLLLTFIEHRDRLLTKDELLERVWPGLVVEENNLAVHVSALRKLLGPQAIATIPGRGYRFAAVLDVDAPPVAAPAPAPAARGVHASLPGLVSPLVGRDDDLAALQQALRQYRVVSLLGAGGIGKTALAIAAAHALRAAHPDGVAWVSLAEIDDPARIAGAVAQATGVALGAVGDPVPALVNALQPLAVLLVLDNAEHLLDGVARLVRTLADGAPALRVLVTSQAPLHLDGERRFRLAALSVPEADLPAAEAIHHGSVALFVQRALAVDRHFRLADAQVPTVTRLCRRLDGMPLAIRLAAARLPLMGLAGLADGLGERLLMLRHDARDAPGRHQTLRAALDWSHDLLRPEEQAVFRRLSVFAGGFSLTQTVHVAGEGLDEWTVADALAELAERCLVVVQAGEPPRHALPETAREYARAKLADAGERDAVQRRHALALADWMDDAYERYWQMPDGPYLDACAAEIDNLRAALDWSRRHDAALAIRLAGSSSVLFMLTGLAPEIRAHQAALEAAAETHDRDAAAIARYWLERSRMNWGVVNASMLRFALRAAEGFRALGDRRGLYLALRCAAGSGELPPGEAAALVDEMAALEQADWPPRVRLQRDLADIVVLRTAGRLADAQARIAALLTLAEAGGFDSVVAASLASLGAVKLALGDAPAAEAQARRVLGLLRARRGNFFLQAIAILAEALLRQERLGEARSALVDFVAASRSRGWEWFGLYAGLLAWLAWAEGRTEHAACIEGHAATHGTRSVHLPAAVSADIEAQVGPATLARLRDEGARLDPQAISTLGLS
ncbi:MAG TPA: winged helix-turn-helix domain-containing protein [Albitalea sp.]|uniref:ATP-binding protein n=1 Tax=Piscinibacter sp. TaxID=1903157 RepID=UPI002ED4EF09